MKKISTLIAIFLTQLAFSQNLKADFSQDAADAASAANSTNRAQIKSVLKFSPSHLSQQKSTPGSCDSITTTFVSNNGLCGAMFNVVADSDLVISGMYSNLSVVSGPFDLYYKLGSMFGYELNASAWTFAGNANIISQGINIPTYIPITFSVALSAGDTAAFYLTKSIVGSFDGLKYTSGIGAGNLYTSNGALKIYEGNGMTYPFDNIYADRIWNGILDYCTTVTGIDEINAVNVSVYPNPSSNTVIFNFVNNDISSIVITNSTGKKMIEENVSNKSSYTLSKDKLNNGIYFYQLFSKNGKVKNGKIILQ